MTLRDLRAWLKLAPPATLVPAADVLAALEQDDAPADASVPAPQGPPAALPTSWRERLWLVPDETRLGVVEVAEALGRPKSWVYRRTGATADSAGVTPLPCRKLDGELAFVAGELRRWIQTHEVAVHAPAVPVTPLRPPPADARGIAARLRAS